MSSIFLVKINADRGIEKMISLPYTSISYRVARIARHLRMQFKGDSGRKVSGGVVSREPVSINVQILIDRIFHGELTARSIGVRSDNIFRKVITARRQPRFPAVKSLADLCVGVIAEVITFVPDRNINVISDDNRNAIFFVVVRFPFDRGNERRGIRAGLNVPRNI